MIAISYFFIILVHFHDYYVMAPGERFELSFPCENALYGKLFPGARPTRLGDPGIIFAKLQLGYHYKNALEMYYLKIFIVTIFSIILSSIVLALTVILYIPSNTELLSFFT